MDNIQGQFFLNRKDQNFIKNKAFLIIFTNNASKRAQSKNKSITTGNMAKEKKNAKAQQKLFKQSKISEQIVYSSRKSQKGKLDSPALVQKQTKRGIKNNFLYLKGAQQLLPLRKRKLIRKLLNGNLHLLHHKRKLKQRKQKWITFNQFVGILGEGLKIAPPEASATGYRFGKVQYKINSVDLADVFEKSADYCCPDPIIKTGLILQCEAALGNPNINYFLILLLVIFQKENIGLGVKLNATLRKILC